MTPIALLEVLEVLDLVSDMEVMVLKSRLVDFAAFLRKANVCAASASVTHVQKSLLRQDVVVDLHQYCLVIR